MLAKIVTILLLTSMIIIGSTFSAINIIGTNPVIQTSPELAWAADCVHEKQGGCTPEFGPFEPPPKSPPVQSGPSAPPPGGSDSSGGSSGGSGVNKGGYIGQNKGKDTDGNPLYISLCPSTGSTAGEVACIKKECPDGTEVSKGTPCPPEQSTPPAPSTPPPVATTPPTTPPTPADCAKNPATAGCTPPTQLDCAKNPATAGCSLEDRRKLDPNYCPPNSICKVDPTEVIFRDPYTGEIRPMTDLEKLNEAFKRGSPLNAIGTANDIIEGMIPIMHRADPPGENPYNPKTPISRPPIIPRGR